MSSSPADRKTILITGCSPGGIGDALAREFHRRGHHVFATARSAASLSALAALPPSPSGGGSITTLPLDVTSPSSIASAVALLSAAHPSSAAGGGGGGGGGLDILVNNAGTYHSGPLMHAPVPTLERLLLTNVLGPLAVTQAFLPLLLLRASASASPHQPGRGSIVASTASVSSVMNPPHQAAYNASKAALLSASHTLRAELAPLGIRVVAVVTGAVRTRLFENADNDSTAEIPAGSPYAPVRDLIERRAWLDGVAFTEPDDYARQVADDLLGVRRSWLWPWPWRSRPRPLRPVLWRAATAWVAWLLDTFAWYGMLDGTYQTHPAYQLGKVRPPASSASRDKT